MAGMLAPFRSLPPLTGIPRGCAGGTNGSRAGNEGAGGTALPQWRHHPVVVSAGHHSQSQSRSSGGGTVTAGAGAKGAPDAATAAAAAGGVMCNGRVGSRGGCAVAASPVSVADAFLLQLAQQAGQQQRANEQQQQPPLSPLRSGAAAHTTTRPAPRRAIRAAFQRSHGCPSMGPLPNVHSCGSAFLEVTGVRAVVSLLAAGESHRPTTIKPTDISQSPESSDVRRQTSE